MAVYNKTMSILNYMFGVASSAAYIRAGGSGDDSKHVIASLAKGFGGRTGDGVYVYDLFNAQTGTFIQSGFDNTSAYYLTLESRVPNLNGLYQLGAAAIIYAYANLPNISESAVLGYINSFCDTLHGIRNGDPVPDPFSLGELDYSLGQFVLSDINREISQIPPQRTDKAINYNWYDAEPMFINANLNSLSQLIKDTECQYYFLSGELLYNNLPVGLKTCISYDVIVSTPTGNITIQKYQNVPCIDNNSYVGPVSGIVFNRRFMDGPPSSGIFDYEMQQAYVNLEVAGASDYRDTSTNKVVMYSAYTDTGGAYIPLRSGVRVDAPGVFQQTREYGVGHTNTILEQCSAHPDWPLVSMHQGDASKKWLFQATLIGTPPSQTCSYSSGQYDWTGWKLTTFELKPELAKNYKNYKTNPEVDTGRIIKRVLNLNNSGSNDTILSPYLLVADTGDGTLTCGDYGMGMYYVGPPQLNDTSALPGFAFYQDFDNVNFPSTGSLASVSVRPMITQNQDNFNVSNFSLFSVRDFVNHAAGDNPQAILNFAVDVDSSGLSTKDDVFRKCFSIGDNFQNSVSGISSVQYNAGYPYTGYKYLRSGVVVSAGELLQNTQKVADKYSTINYPIGYKSGVHSFYINGQIGYIITGDDSTGVFTTGIPQIYEYFNSGVLGAQIGYWQGSEFAPPSQAMIDNVWELTPIYASTNVENYLPRYISGPYLTYDSKFLYPNADLITNNYFNAAGFPTGVTYSVTIKEETVREIYLVSGFNGQVLHRKVIRAGSDGLPSTLETIMTNPFIPNDSTYSYKYDYLRNKSLFPDDGGFENRASITVPLVDENYVPSRDYCPQGNLNSSTHTEGGAVTFSQGVKITGKVLPRKIYVNKSGKFENRNFTEPIGGDLIWGYNSRNISGQMIYCPPVFDLHTYTLSPSQELIKALLDDVNGSTENTCSNDGKILYASLFDYSNENGYAYNGRDPIFYEYVGGRSGQGAEAEGGYHSKGIIGDAWYNFDSQVFGNGVGICVNSYTYRDPRNDKYLSIFDLTPTGLTIFARGMLYYPYYMDWKYQPYTTSSIGTIGVSTTSKEVSHANFYFDFDMKSLFYPLKSGDANKLYYPTGFSIGPFDRDVELCITGVGLVPSGSLIVDGRQITDRSWIPGAQCIDPVTLIYPSTGILTGDSSRYGKVTTFKLVPSGYSVNINISGTGLIGIDKYAPVTIRPRTCLGATDGNSADIYALSGDLGYLDSLRYIDNGTEASFRFPIATKFEELQGRSMSFMTVTNESILYPRPPASDFDIVLKPTLDTFGNKIYKSAPTKVYWKARNPNGMFSGYRDVTRVNITINSISVENGEFPYQTFQTVIPSGRCTVSGSFGYSAQAEAAVIANGIVLTGISGASLLTGRFNPIYVSEVLQRLPTGIYTIPSGSGISPVLPAPSYLKTRKYVPQITTEDEYVFVSPYSGSHYNAFLWPAWSDLALLNPEEVYEQLPPDDGNVFPDSYLTFSAAQGQSLSSGQNPTEDVTYAVAARYVMIDSIATNSIYNTGKCIFSGSAAKDVIHSGDLSGILTSEGNSLTMALNLNNFRV